MITVKSIRKAIAACALFAAVAFSLSLLAPALTAQAAPAPTIPATPPAPLCAVVNFGPIGCPKDIGNFQPGFCYVRDPGSTDPALRDWHGPAVPAAPGSKSTTTGSKTGCDLPEYINAAKPPTAIDCSAAKPGSTPTSGNTGAPSEYCDPAFACGKASTAPPTAPSNGGTNENTCNLMVKYVNPIIKGLAAVVGIGVTVSIVFAGIQYAMSADDSSKVSAAKSRITNSLLTLLGFFLFFAFLNWVIPGGINLKP